MAGVRVFEGSKVVLSIEATLRRSKTRYGMSEMLGGTGGRGVRTCVGVAEGGLAGGESIADEG